MKNENEKLDQLFENLENQWDIQEMDAQHHSRFSKKLALKKRKRNFGFFVCSRRFCSCIDWNYYVLSKSRQSQRTEICFKRNQADRFDFYCYD